MEKPIRILHVFGRLDSGGAESRTMDIYRSIDRTKIQFDFAIHTSDECYFSAEVRSLGGKIYSFPRFRRNNLFSYKKAWSQFFLRYRSRYEIVHGHQTSTGFIYLNEAKKNGIRTRIAHARNSDKDSAVKRLTTRLARFYATELLAVSAPAAKSEFGERLMRSGTVKVIPNAININKYIFNENIRLIKRKEFGLSDELAVVHIGRFHSQKNHHFLLKIFKEVLRKNPNSKLFIVGDGPLKDSIKQTIIELKIEGSVVLTGVRKDVADLLQAMDFLIFPSLFEGLPGVVLEAQAAGLPCIISESITDEVKVTDLVEYASLNESEENWADKVLRKLDKSYRKDTFEEIANKGFDINSVAKWYEEFYLKLKGK
ncbi:glycosyltransferase family 1 protein [Paenalkalicoccus suaedae]|uniref:Glycosyltransferase family 1 protein n=1 Tax=Paenalkalicoccus suaedae TaxID=2592382 RepID=A0A859FJ76_9BACI|nr:glycosyltransferase family 1 protein [Paenalkalicoccus suaedae]QKS72606.1 glycosyltransferase family 1 protein [Paenalkalicoccus suaedae]